ncbi:MAG: hypothetical protein R3C58_08300 [Parvularculaceae bacterium]
MGCRRREIIGKASGEGAVALKAYTKNSDHFLDLTDANMRVTADEIARAGT